MESYFPEFRGTALSSPVADAGDRLQDLICELNFSLQIRHQNMCDFELMVKEYRLTTAEILYHMPDHPSVLQTYIWQNLDIAPKFPVLHKFLDFWESSLDGRLHSVNIASARLIQPNRFRYASALMRLH